MINLEQVHMFMQAVEEGSFSAAARAVGKSHTAVSVAINTLEDTLNIKLFDRSRKYPVLTAEGQRLYEQSTLLMRQVSRIESSAMSSVKEIENKVSLGLGEMIPFSLVDETLEKVARKFPDTKLLIERDTYVGLKERMNRGELDLLIATNSESVPEQNFFTIATSEYCCICAPDSELADLEKVDNDTLISHRQIYCRAMLDNPILSQQALFSSDGWIASSLNDVIQLVEQGVGWALVPLQVVQEQLASGTVKVFKPEVVCSKIWVHVDLLTTNDDDRGPVQNFLIEQLKSISSDGAS